MEEDDVALRGRLHAPELSLERAVRLEQDVDGAQVGGIVQAFPPALIVHGKSNALRPESLDRHRRCLLRYLAHQLFGHVLHNPLGPPRLPNECLRVCGFRPRVSTPVDLRMKVDALGYGAPVPLSRSKA